MDSRDSLVPRVKEMTVIVLGQEHFFFVLLEKVWFLAGLRPKTYRSSFVPTAKRPTGQERL